MLDKYKRFISISLSLDSEIDPLRFSSRTRNRSRQVSKYHQTGKPNFLNRCIPFLEIEKPTFRWPIISLKASICLSTFSTNRIEPRRGMKNTKFGLSRVNKPIYENRFIKHGCIAWIWGTRERGGVENRLCRKNSRDKPSKHRYPAEIYRDESRCVKTALDELLSRATKNIATTVRETSWFGQFNER